MEGKNGKGGEKVEPGADEENFSHKSKVMKIYGVKYQFCSDSFFEKTKKAENREISFKFNYSS